jgi:ribosomal protein S12 methylthiotransferase accessory factor
LTGLTLDWIPAFNLTQGREYLVPINWFYEINEFNGPAAGNTLEEAISQGLCEIIERHVSALVCRGHLDLPSIDPDSLQTPVGRELVDKFRRQNIRLFIKDFSLDMGVATVGALAYDPETFPHLSEIVFTAGTATHPEKAVIRALTEVAQLAGDFNTKANFIASGLPKYTDPAQADYITKDEQVVQVDALPDISTDNIKDEIETAVKRLADKGFEVYVINATHPELGIPVVYTIVPGAHFRERARGSSVPFFAAKLLTTQSHPIEAAAGIEHLDRLYPNSYYINFYKGQSLIEEGRLPEALQALENALQPEAPDEDTAGILTYQGLALKEMEEYDRAIQALERSAEVDDERQDTFNLLGFCYFKTKQHEKAIEAFTQVLRLDPGSGIDYANIGTNYRELGRMDDAVRYYKIALDLDPSLDWVRDNLARLGG